MADLQSVLSSPSFQTLDDATRRRLLKEQFGVADDHMDKILSTVVGVKQPPPPLNLFGNTGAAIQNIKNFGAGALEHVAAAFNPQNIMAAVGRDVTQPALDDFSNAGSEVQKGNVGSAALWALGAPFAGLSNYVRGKIESGGQAVGNLLSGNVGSAVNNAADVIPFVPSARAAVDAARAAPDQSAGYGGLAGDITAALLMGKAPEIIPRALDAALPPALAAIQKHGPRIVESAAPIAGGVLIDRALGGSGVVGAVAGPLLKEHLFPKKVAPPKITPEKLVRGVPAAEAKAIIAHGKALEMEVARTAAVVKSAEQAAFKSGAIEAKIADWQDAPTEGVPVADFESAMAGLPPKIKATGSAIEDHVIDALKSNADIGPKEIAASIKQTFDIDGPTAEVLAKRIVNQRAEARANELHPATAKKPKGAKESSSKTPTPAPAPASAPVAAPVTPSAKPLPPALQALEDAAISGPEAKDLYWGAATRDPQHAQLSKLSAQTPELPGVAANATEIVPSRTGIDVPARAKVSGRTFEVLSKDVGDLASQVGVKATSLEEATALLVKKYHLKPAYAHQTLEAAIKAWKKQPLGDL